MDLLENLEYFDQSSEVLLLNNRNYVSRVLPWMILINVATTVFEHATSQVY